MKAINLLALGILMSSLSACGSSTGIKTIDGSSAKDVSPVVGDTKSEESTGSDETISPEKDAPSKSPEATAPKEGDKSAKAAPETPVISYAPSGPIFIPLAPISSKRTLSLVDSHPVACEDCWNGSGTSHTFLCPSGSVVTGFEIGVGEFAIGDGKCESRWYDKLNPFPSFETCGTGGVPVVGGLKIRCSPLDLDGTHPEDSSFAFYLLANPDSGTFDTVTLAGSTDRADLSDACGDGSNVATGVFGRRGDRLDSFGLFCGAFFSNDKATAIIPLSKETHTGEDAVYGGMPGNGGFDFEARCDTNEAVVGVTVASDGQVNGLQDIVCAKVERR